jgi:hypothetical protein
MTITANRTNAAARTRTPMSAANVRALIDEIVTGWGKKACARTGRLALRSGPTLGNISPEGLQVWREWFAENGIAAE